MLSLSSCNALPHASFSPSLFCLFRHIYSNCGKSNIHLLPSFRYITVLPSELFITASVGTNFIPWSTVLVHSSYCCQSCKMLLISKVTWVRALPLNEVLSYVYQNTRFSCHSPHSFLIHPSLPNSFNVPTLRLTLFAINMFYCSWQMCSFIYAPLQRYCYAV